MKTLNLLYKREYEINDYISVYIPELGEVLEQEDEYFFLVSLFTAMPIDLMVQLDEFGIDFTEINEFELFVILFEAVIKEKDTSLIFKKLDMGDFFVSINEQNGNIILENQKTGAKIDRAIHGKIASALRKIHHLEKNTKKPANGEAKDYMLERAKAKAKRNRNRVVESELEQLIVAMVNSEQFKYKFEDVLKLSIYQFNESVRQVIKKNDYNNRMHGIYSGTVNAKELSQDDLNWLKHK